MTTNFRANCSANGFLIFAFTLIFSGCSNVPRKNLEIIQQIPTDKIHSSEREVLEKNPPQLVIRNACIDFSFSRSSPIVKTKYGISTATTVRFENVSSKRYLIVWSWLHKSGFGKVSAAVPHLTVFDSKLNIRNVKLAQEGEEDACGIFRCWKMAYDISELESGPYEMVLVPQVEDPEKIVVLSKINTGVLNLPEIPFYADYFGEARLTFDSNLPFPIK